MKDISRLSLAKKNHKRFPHKSKINTAYVFWF